MTRGGLRRGLTALALALPLGAAAEPARADDAPLVCGVDEAAEAAAAPVPVDWTIGRKTVLYLRVQFADQASEPESKRDAKRKMAAASRFFAENSYDRLSLKTKIPKTLRLPGTNAEYAAAGITAVRNDALAAALAIGQSWTEYDLDVIQYAGGPGDFGGTAVIGGRGCWLRSTTAGVAIHELGHNLGLHHSNGWQTSDESVVGPGLHVEYLDPFDTMGPALGDLWHFNARQKAALGWIDADHIETVASSGTYRVFAHDLTASDGAVRALEIPRDASFHYWVELRQLFTDPLSLGGAGLRRARFAYDSVGTQLLDTTPGTPAGHNDAPLAIGRTFSDAEAGIHVTPVARGGTEPESLDVVVQIGSFEANQPPTVSLEASTLATQILGDVALTATASDPDGDALAYAWDFGDGSLGPNGAEATKHWFEESEFVVRCTVSDTKGGVASDSLVVAVGPVTRFRIEGEVFADGLPLEGVHVHNGVASQPHVSGFTDSDGRYVIAGVPAGEYTLEAAKPGHTLAPDGFANPVSVGPDATGVDWSAEPSPALSAR